MNILSLIFPIKLYQAKTLSGEEISVREIGGLKSLEINGCPQSNYIFRYHWKAIIKNLKLKPTGRVLILGLGGGDLVKLFNRKFPNWEITAIELEPEVITIAKKYFGIRESKLLKIVNTDAKKYVEKSKHKFDLIIEDIYDGDEIPKWVVNIQFINKLVGMLTSEGMLIFNYASYAFKLNDYQRFNKLLEKTGKKHTEQIYLGHRYYLVKN